MLIHLESIRCQGPYVLRVTFSDAVTKDVDLATELWGEMCEPLEDETLFRQARVGESRTVDWPNGADLAPEFLYDAGQTVQPAP